MNLLLFNAKELSEDNKIVLFDDRAAHLIEVLKAKPQQKIRAGMLNGKLGTAKVISVDKREVSLLWQAESDPPAALDCILVLALPRPKMMRRVLQNISAMGVKEIHLINSWKVEKSYWQSPWLSDDALGKQLQLGLAQSVDTKMPSVHLHRLFKPFAEDILPTLCQDSRLAFVAHPYNSSGCPIDVKEPSILAIGPEGGFTDYEIDLFHRAGLQSVNIGPRLLRVETAVPALLSRLYPA